MINSNNNVNVDVASNVNSVSGSGIFGDSRATSVRQSMDDFPPLSNQDARIFSF